MAQNPGNQPGRGKPGAMTMAMQAVAQKPTGPKVLRIGLIQDGKIVEERVIRRRETVSVGTSEKNQFIIQAQGLPSKFDLFQIVGNDYILNFTDAMDGRVGLPGGVKELNQLRSGGGARKSGDHYQVKLNDNSRGKVQIGNTTLLFQFVVPPPVTPRPQLPAAARGGFVKGIDWLFTAFVVFSYMTFFGFVIYLENADWEIEQTNAAVPELMARLLINEPEPPPEPVETEPTESEEGEGEEEAEETTAPSSNNNNSSAVSDNSNSNNVNTNAEARARIAEQAMASAESLLLGALGEGGALNDVLAGGAVTGNASEILAQAAGVGVASGSSGDLRERGGGGDGSGQGGMLGAVSASMTAGMSVSTGMVEERAVRGRINLQNGGDIGGSGDFDANLVVQQIRRRLSAIQRCYENELRRDPTLAGKVTVQFTIVERGTVSNASASENTTGSPAVATCVVRTVSSFRFNPGPEGGSVQFRYPFVFAPQN